MRDAAASLEFELMVGIPLFEEASGTGPVFVNILY
jgi:hypothetical protein